MAHPGEIAVILRSAYDPAVAAALERHGQIGQQLTTAGPVAVKGTWTRISTDSAHHAVLWISEGTRSMATQVSFLPSCPPAGIQRSFSLI